MVAQTSGVLLGLVGLKEGSIAGNPAYHLVGVLIMILGAWGIYSSLVFESRARRHRKRIDKVLVRLGETVGRARKKHSFIWVWVLFHVLISAVGATVTFYPWQELKKPKPSAHPVEIVISATADRISEIAHNTTAQADGSATA
jgi:hypothetical protein